MPQNILIVDDDPSVAKSLGRLLRGDSHRVTICHDPGSAIEAINTNKFDIILTDRHMGGNTEAGFEVAQAARARGNARIIMISGDVSAALLPVIQKRLSSFGGETLFIAKDGSDFPNKIIAAASDHPKSPSILDL